MLKEETVKKIEKIKEDLKEKLSEKRYNHSISVMNKAIELAELYDEDVDEAALAGLAHDMAKEISFEDSLKIAKENGIEFDEIELNNHKLIHGKLGGFLAGNRYGLNERIQKAICYHTETYFEMDNLAKIVFIADKIEDLRSDDEPGIKEEREMAKKGLDECMLLIINGTIKRLIEKGRVIHPAELITRNYLLLKKKSEI